MTAPLVNTPDGIRSACCNAGIAVERVVQDTIVYDATEFVADEVDISIGTLSIEYRKTYDDPDGAYSVTCTKCGADVAEQLSLEER